MLLFRLLTYRFPFRSKCPQTFLHCFLICAQLLCDSSLLFPFRVLYQLKVWSLYLQSLSDPISCIPTSWIPDISLFLSSLHFFTFHNASFSLSQTMTLNFPGLLPGKPPRALPHGSPVHFQCSILTLFWGLLCIVVARTFPPFCLQTAKPI